MSKLGRSVVAMVLAGTLLLAACGGDDDDLSDALTAADDDGGDDGDRVDDAAGLAGLPAKCARAALAMSAAIAGAYSGADLGDAVDQLEDVAEAAPKELKSDFALIAATYERIAKAWKDAGIDASKPGTTPADQAKYAAVLGTVSAQIDSDDFEAANDRVSTWFDEECGEG
ncbi:MAG: hypothetical protein AB7H43_13610 [Acidimicrobiia bacterium]